MMTILAQLLPEVEILTLLDFPHQQEPEETGTTYAENATIKAEHAAAHTGEWCLADDAGLEIDALGGAPGLYSKRFGGEEMPFPEKMGLLLAELEGQANRSARFRCCVALANPSHDTRVFEACCEGSIATTPSGRGGFGYDPIFWLPEMGCTMADLTSDQKHAISHRGKVLRLFALAFESLRH